MIAVKLDFSLFTPYYFRLERSCVMLDMLQNFTGII
jgi:hypothetical protein